MVDIQRADPIFIHGITPRSGTNFLCDLLLLHPQCARGRDPVREDLFLQYSDHLVAFTEAVRANWDPIWGTFGTELPYLLRAGIGEGLVSFLWTDRDRRLLTKTPNVRNLERFFSFFPWARLLILVRDGRSVVQSGMDTFGWDFDRACREWSQAADIILQFEVSEAARADRWRLVRYEDLLDEPQTQLKSLFTFLDLDATCYDFEAARSLPVRGSSAFGRRSTGVHWDSVEKDASFAPKDRWRSWTAWQLERFEWLAGEQMRALGYDARSPARRTLRSTARHLALDARWAARRASRVARTQLGTASRPLRRRLGLVR